MKKYEILGKLGQGGMGIVLKGRQRSLDRVVAIKILPQELTSNAQAKQRFEKEIQILAGLSHPNIVGIIDRGDQDGNLYYVMDFVQGRPLDVIVKTEGAQSKKRVLKVARDVLEAFEYYHPKQLVHRDLKPANLMIESEGGRVIVMDFGLVKVLTESGMTVRGQLLGSPKYMSPEMVKGLRVDRRSDIYQLGLILYEMAAGKPAFSGESFESVLYAIMHQDAVEPSKHNPLVSEGLNRFILKAMARSAQDRYQDAEEMKEALGLLERGGEIPGKAGGMGLAGAAGRAVVAGVGLEGRDEVRPRRMLKTLNLPSGGDVPAVEEEIPRKGPAVLVALAVLMAAGVMFQFTLMPREVVYSARDVRVVAGYDRAEVTWRSEEEYPSILDVGPGEATMRRVEGEREPGTVHSVVLEGLEEGATYRYQLVYPEEQRSPVYTFTTRTVSFGTARVTERVKDRIVLELDSSHPVRCSLEWRGDSGRIERSAVGEAGTRHRLVVTGRDVGVRGEYRILATDPDGALRSGEWRGLRPIGEVLAEAGDSLVQVPAHAWIQAAHKKRLPEELEALNATMERTWAVHPGRKAADALRSVGAELVWSGASDQSEVMRVLSGLENLADLDQYARRRGLKFRTGGEELIARIGEEREGAGEVEGEGVTWRGLSPVARLLPIKRGARGDANYVRRVEDLFEGTASLQVQVERPAQVEPGGLEVWVQCRLNNELNVLRLRGPRGATLSYRARPGVSSREAYRSMNRRLPYGGTRASQSSKLISRVPSLTSTMCNLQFEPRETLSFTGIASNL